MIFVWGKKNHFDRLPANQQGKIVPKGWNHAPCLKGNCRGACERYRYSRVCTVYFCIELCDLESKNLVKCNQCNVMFEEMNYVNAVRRLDQMIQGSIRQQQAMARGTPNAIPQQQQLAGAAPPQPTNTGESDDDDYKPLMVPATPLQNYESFSDFADHEATPVEMVEVEAEAEGNLEEIPNDEPTNGSASSSTHLVGDASDQPVVQAQVMPSGELMG